MTALYVVVILVSLTSVGWNLYRLGQVNSDLKWLDRVGAINAMSLTVFESYELPESLHRSESLGDAVEILLERNDRI